ncbi:MAG: ATP-binding protein [Alphaproteobacteria bacterium]|nr:ATP-binding protein [Alphaproteobacteria bacterium]
MSTESSHLVQQALGNLVKQFANPLDCLRELVQNSIDAGTPRIEIELRYSPKEPGRGVLEIAVADFGQGMDEHVIDTQLTRLFSSAKEGDLGTIGKFGIGFTSVFALDPALVRVLTGKHGENWEILFHADRSFERRKWEGPVQGTSITLYKRVRQGAVADIVKDARATLVRWCEHAETPITFLDLTAEGVHDGEAPSEGGDDVFAAFDAGPVAETLNRPFELEDCELQLRLADGEVEAVVGYALEPRWAFFSGGLTLLRTTDPGHLGTYQNLVQHLSFKVRSRRIEHTLTRDNVIQDEAWHAAMEVVVKAARKLREQLEARTEAVARDGGDVQQWHHFLALDARHEAIPWGRKLFVDLGGRPRCLDEVAPLGPFGREAWLASPEGEELGWALWRKGIKVLPGHAATRSLLLEALPAHRVLDAAKSYVVTRPVPLDSLIAAHQQAFQSAASHLGVATGNVVRLGVCEVEGSDLARTTLFVEGQAQEGLMRRPERHGAWGAARRAWMQMAGAFMFQRWVVVNVRHPHVARLLSLADTDPDLAGLAIAQAVMVEEGGYDESAYDSLAIRAARDWLRDV